MSNSTELFLATTSDLGISIENEERTFDPYKIMHERAPSAMSNPACAMALGLARLNVAHRVGALDRMPTGPLGAIQQLTGMVGGFVGGQVSGLDFVGHMGHGGHGGHGRGGRFGGGGFGGWGDGGTTLVIIDGRECLVDAQGQVIACPPSASQRAAVGYTTDGMGRVNVGYTTDPMGRVEGAAERSRVGYTTDGYGRVQGLTDDSGFSNADPNAVLSSPSVPGMTASNQGGLDSFFGQLGPGSPLMPATPLDPSLLGPLPGDPGGIPIPDVSALPPGIPQQVAPPPPKAQPIAPAAPVTSKKSLALPIGLALAAGAVLFHKQLGF